MDLRSKLEWNWMGDDFPTSMRSVYFCEESDNLEFQMLSSCSKHILEHSWAFLSMLEHSHPYITIQYQYIFNIRYYILSCKFPKGWIAKHSYSNRAAQYLNMNFKATVMSVYSLWQLYKHQV